MTFLLSFAYSTWFHQPLKEGENLLEFKPTLLNLTSWNILRFGYLIDNCCCTWHNIFIISIGRDSIIRYSGILGQSRRSALHGCSWSCVKDSSTVLRICRWVSTTNRRHIISWSHRSSLQSPLRVWNWIRPQSSWPLEIRPSFHLRIGRRVYKNSKKGERSLHAIKGH